MIEEITNHDRIVGILRTILLDKSASIPLQETTKFILDDVNIDKQTDRLSSILVIAQRIFEDHPEALVEMMKLVLRNKLK